MSWLFASSGFSIKLQLQHHPSNEYSELISFKKSGLISLLSKGLSRVFSRTTVQKLLNVVQLSHPYMTTGETIALTIWTFVGKVISLLFITLSSFVTAILKRSKSLLISWLQSPSAVILEPKKMKSDTVSTFSPSICPERWDQMPWSSFFECWLSSQLFHFHLSHSSGVSLVPLHFLSLEWYHLHIWGCWYLSQNVDSSL